MIIKILTVIVSSLRDVLIEREKENFMNDH